MRHTLLAISISAALAIPCASIAANLTDESGSQSITGDQTYERVLGLRGNTITFSNGSITADNSKNPDPKAPALRVTGGSTVNFGTSNDKLGTVSVIASQNAWWTGYIREGELNVYAQKYVQSNSESGIYAIGEKSIVNLMVDEFESTSTYEALHVREGTGAVINVGSKEAQLTSFKATKTANESGVSLLQANEGGTINIFSKYAELNAFDTHVGGGAIGTGAWGTINIAADELKINGSINGDYGGLYASKTDDVFAVNINAGKLTMVGGIYAGVTGKKASGDVGVSTATNRKEVIKITATDAGSSITGDIEATTKSETTITFLNGGTLTGDIKTSNIQNEGSNNAVVTTQSQVTLAGKMTYKGDATLVGSSTLNFSGDIDASESKITSDETSSVAVTGSTSVGTLTSTSTKSDAVKVAEGSTLELTTGESSVKNLTNNGDLLVSGSGTAKLDTIAGSATVSIDTAANTVAITNVDPNSTVKARGTANFNDAAKDANAALDQLLRNVTVTNSSLETASVDEGSINGRITAVKNDQGEWISTEAKNSKLDAYSSVSALSTFQWRHEMNDLTKRMGELRDSSGQTGAWARVYGSELEYGTQNVLQKNNSVQVGADHEVVPGFRLGAAFSYTDSSSEYAAGSADGNAYGLGIYGTWMAENGMFVDAIAKYVRLDTDFDLNGFSGSFDNNAFSVSAEFGWRFDLSDLAFVEPQVELSYGRVAGDAFTGANGVRIEQDDFDTLIGRAGIRAGFKFPENKGNVYAKFSAAHDFQGELDAVASNGVTSRPLSEDLGGTWVEYGVGANFTLCRNAYAYVDLERTSGGEVDANYRWNVGLRTFF